MSEVVYGEYQDIVEFLILMAELYYVIYILSKLLFNHL